MPDPPLWSFDGYLGVSLLAISVICVVFVCICSSVKSGFSIQRQLNNCIWLPMLSIVFLVTKRVSYELWIMHYYGRSSDPAQIAEDRAIVVGNASCFVLLLFVIIVIKITASAIKEKRTNKAEMATASKPSD